MRERVPGPMSSGAMGPERVGHCRVTLGGDTNGVRMTSLMSYAELAIALRREFGDDDHQYGLRCQPGEVRVSSCLPRGVTL